jgi:LysM repeat protein
MLVQLDIMKPPVYTVKVVARPGQTLGQIASRYGTSVRTIMQANGLTSTQIRAGRAYRIPVRAAAPPMGPILMPRRTLPPATPAVLATVDWPTPASLYGSGQQY